MAAVGDGPRLIENEERNQFVVVGDYRVSAAASPEQLREHAEALLAVADFIEALPGRADELVESDRCPAVLRTKVRCDDIAGHPGAHWSLRQVEGGAARREYWPADADVQ